MRRTIYLDHNATTRPAPEVRAGVLEWMENWGNPSSIHQLGRGPKALMRWSRQQISKAIGADSLELVFTSSGSEANNLALKGAFFKAIKSGKNHLLVSRVEHPSIIKTAQWLETQGAIVEWISVSREGRIDLELYKKQLRPTTALVSCMLANNETGTLFPIREMAQAAHQVGALFHTDAVQALGKQPVHIDELGVDLASFSGHKFYALKGAGFLYIRRGVVLDSLIHGGGQERGRRAGTENLLAIASLASVCSRLTQINQKVESMRALRDGMEAKILNLIRNVSVTAMESDRLTNTSSLVIQGVDGESLLMNLDMEGFCVSTGAACSSGSQEPSPALRAMGLTREEAQNSLRVSIGWDTTQEDLDLFVEKLSVVVARIRSVQQAGGFQNVTSPTL